MAGYRLSRLADSQQDDIWRYTVKIWGENQAETYIEGLHAQFQKLSQIKALWRRLPQKLVVHSDVSAAVYVRRYREHLIFFRELSDGTIGIISVLHSRSDIPVRLMENLSRVVGSGNFDP